MVDLPTPARAATDSMVKAPYPTFPSSLSAALRITCRDRSMRGSIARAGRNAALTFPLDCARAPDRRSRTFTQTGFRHGRLEQLDRVAGGVVEQDLLAAPADDDVVAEAGAGLAQGRDHGFEVGDFDREPIPAAWLRHPAVGHGLAAARPAAGLAQDQAQIAPRQHGEGGRRMHDFREAKLLAIEDDRRIDIADEVADLNGGHDSSRSRYGVVEFMKRNRFVAIRQRIGRRPASMVFVGPSCAEVSKY